MTKGRLRLHSHAEQIAHFSFTYDKVNKMDSVRPSGVNGRLYNTMLIRKYTNIKIKLPYQKIESTVDIYEIPYVYICIANS